MEYGYASDNNAATIAKCKKTKQAEIVSEKDRQIAELRAKNAELEKECELLRGRLFMTIKNRLKG